ncbi:hypothetical protein QFZ43_000116 [Streptomyces afghaniensis]|nr:hypothetical protein [Streptomyces afghaniensis]
MDIKVVIETAAHPWEFGWDALVAIGTLVLAAFTWRLAARTRQLAKETAADQRAQWRPVLIPHHNTPEERDRGNPSPAVKFKRVAEDLSAYVRNAGRGPALHVRAQLQGELTLANPYDWSIGALGGFVWISGQTRGRCPRCEVRRGRWSRSSRSGWRCRATASGG